MSEPRRFLTTDCSIWLAQVANFRDFAMTQ
jgi:hypothetical protein